MKGKNWRSYIGRSWGIVRHNFSHRLLKSDVERFLTFGYLFSVPQRQLMLGYLSYFLLGGLLLCLPFMMYSPVSVVDHQFTAMSAVSTMGLSSGLCVSLSVWGKMILILPMFVGRVGVLTVGNAMLTRMNRESQTPKEDLAV